MNRSSSVVSSYVGEKRKPKGEVIFTGPDGIRQHRVKVKEEPWRQRYVGRSAASPEATGDMYYLVRASKVLGHD